MTEPKTKWAVAEDRVDDLKDACAPERLLARAYTDCLLAFARFVEEGRPPEHVLAVIKEWTDTFERMREGRAS